MSKGLGILKQVGNALSKKKGGSGELHDDLGHGKPPTPHADVSSEGDPGHDDMGQAGEPMNHMGLDEIEKHIADLHEMVRSLRAPKSGT